MQGRRRSLLTQEKVQEAVCKSDDIRNSKNESSPEGNETEFYCHLGLNYYI